MDIHMNYGNHEKSEAYVYRKFGPLKIRWRVWAQWYKNNTNWCGYKMLVLFGLRHSPTFDLELILEQLHDTFPGTKIDQINIFDNENHWWNTVELNKPEEVIWDPSSFKAL